MSLMSRVNVHVYFLQKKMLQVFLMKLSSHQATFARLFKSHATSRKVNAMCMDVLQKYVTPNTQNPTLHARVNPPPSLNIRQGAEVWKLFKQILPCSLQFKFWNPNGEYASGILYLTAIQQVTL